MSYFKGFTFSLGCKYNGKNNLSSCINDETCLYCQFANCSIIQGSANVRQASKAWTVRFLANAGGEQKFNLWQSCKILLALTIFSKMFLWLQIWDRLRLPVLLLLQELSRLRLGDRRVSVQPGQSWCQVFVKEVTCIFRSPWGRGFDHMVADPGNVKCHPPLKRSQKEELRGVVLSLGNTIH